VEYTGAMPVTRDDVARTAGVSVATVSYVLNGGPRPVSEARRRRVLQAVADLGYRPNAIARSLRARRTRILGLVLPDSANPYFAALAKAIEEAAAAREYQVIVANAAERPEREAAHIEALLRLQVDGLFWIPADLRRATRDAPRPAVPTVQVDRTLDPSGDDDGEGAGGHRYDVVAADNRAGGRLAAAHLLALGHRRLACLAGPASHRHAQARLQGFRDALREVGGASGLVAHGDFDFASGAAIAARWCALPAAERPTGIVCGNDAMAVGALAAVARAGLRVPRDLSVTGFDDLPLAPFTVPPLTTVAQPVAELAEAAVERLLTRIERPAVAPPPRHTVFPVRLVVRGSTGAPGARRREARRVAPVTLAG
jgi:LacI family transcriptional regulator, galactose operon repressor